MHKKIFIICFFSTSVFGLTLKEAEDISIKKSFKASELKAKNQSLDFKKDQLKSSFIPNLNLTYLKEKQVNPKEISIKNANINLRINLKNPFYFLSQKKQISSEKDLVFLEMNEENHKTYYQLRLTYFEVKLLEEKISQTKKHLEKIEGIISINDKKYKQGHIHILEKNRSIIEKIKLTQALSSLQLDYQGKIQVISLLLNFKHNIKKLSTPLPDRFENYFLKEKFKNHFLEKKSLIESKNLDASLSLEQSKYSPNFYISYQKDFLQNNKKRESYFLGINWALSSESFFASKSIRMQKTSQSFRQKEREKTSEINYIKLKVQLNSILKKISSQKKIAHIYQNLSKKNMERYNQGSVSLKEYYEDFRMLIAEENNLLLQKFEAIKLLAQLSLLMKNECIFHKGIKSYECTKFSKKP